MIRNFQTATIVLLLLLSFISGAQAIDQAILQKRWPAFWVTVPNESADGYGVYLFRKTVELNTKPETFIIHVSADNRYKLFVNEKLVSLGPARGDLSHWNFETVDIATYLKAGKNILAAQVWNEGEWKPEAQISSQTGFILQGGTNKESVVNTNSSWKCMRDSSYAPLQFNARSYYVAGAGEIRNMALHPRLWYKENFDDNNWQKAKQLFNGLPKTLLGPFGSPNGWMLVPSAIPQMELKDERLAKLVDVSGGVNLPAEFPAQQKEFTIPAASAITIILDQSHLTNAYSNLLFSGGKNAIISISYAETMYLKFPVKGNRNETKGMQFFGRTDSLISDGTGDQIFTSLTYRTYRYVRLKITTQSEPLAIKDFYGTFTGYPFELKASATGTDEEINKILSIGWRTARLCATKLIWTVDEKEFLIDSILNGFPIPLILLAQLNDKKFEIVDGLQRLNALFSFVENGFTYKGKYFDVNQFARAKQVSESGAFESVTAPETLLEAKLSADFLDYQLAVTTYATKDETVITDVFGRINSSGKQLSFQERRQAGSTDDFSTIVREISSEIRGDSSSDAVIPKDMPTISIDSKREKIGYGLTADEIFWCKQGIIWKSQLRDSEDEELVADIVASIVLNHPIPRSKEYFDNLYSSTEDLHKNVVLELNKYGKERIKHEIKVTFSVIRDILDKGGAPLNKIVNPGNFNPVKGSFYAIFMAFHHLVVKEEKSPDDNNKILAAIDSLQKQMISTAHFSTTEDRIKNIDKTIGLIQRYFIKKEPALLKHGAGLAIDFENSIRRSRTETNRYECKQGFVDLSNDRKIDNNLQNVIIETICGIANLGSDSEGYIFIGVADKKADKDRIEQLDGVTAISINDRFVVGIDRELKYFDNKEDNYINFLLGNIQKSKLSEPLKTQMLSQLDVIDYKGLTVIRLKIPSQKQLSFVDKNCFYRENSKTIKVEGQGIIALYELFKKQ